MVASHRLRRKPQQGEEKASPSTFSDYHDTLLVSSKSSSSASAGATTISSPSLPLPSSSSTSQPTIRITGFNTTAQQIKTMDYSAEALLDFNFTKASNDSSSFIENFSHQLFDLNTLSAGSRSSSPHIANGHDVNSTVVQVVYDGASLNPATFLSSDTTSLPMFTTAATAASVTATADANGGLVMDTLLGSVMTTATATVTSAASRYQGDVYETTAISSMSTMRSANNDSAYWELEASDFDFLYRHSLTMTIVYCIAYVIVFLVGLVGNGFVIAVVLRMRNMRTVTNYFIVNLAIADILVIVFCLPATLMSNIFVPWILGWLMCKTVPYIQGVSVAASVYSLIAVSLDRKKMGSKQMNLNKIYECAICLERHSLRYCRIFCGMTVADRRVTVRNHKYCMNCLARSHEVEDCHSAATCRKCGYQHHTMLHPQIPVPPTALTPAYVSPKVANRYTKKATTEATPRRKKLRTRSQRPEIKPSELLQKQLLAEALKCVATVICEDVA